MATNTIQLLELAIAQKRLYDYSNGMANTSEASDDPAEVERLVEQAIDSLRWIGRAEETLRQGIYDALIEYTPEFDETLQALYREWLAVCVDTEQLLAREVERGHAAAHADEFRESAAIAREKVNSMAWVRKSRKFRNEPAVDASDD